MATVAAAAEAQANTGVHQDRENARRTGKLCCARNAASEPRFHARRSFHFAPLFRHGAQPRRQRPVRSPLRMAAGALRQVVRLRFRDVVAPLGQVVPKLLAIHIAYLIGFQASTASRGFRSWFNFSSSKARARCMRERTVPMGQPNATAASA